ncbi:type I methionyl aminopeptidase [Cohnella silvisoli]|uniref:Methionine aminopeptidase n=1 Tax=Cohnella silvisoli TaxID=2873699 RepID=A0ABV1KNB6_9BACL|nr:type I methionyl aminopeptidase [Cohnella silvisoli]MCD9020351.1 type I methionyl aminopeptidase [Cohnella silvisoli]
MTIESQYDIDQLSRIGKIVAFTIEEMKKSAEPGITTQQLDDIGRDVLARYGAVSAPMKTFGFPGHTCISLNSEVAHGIPGNRVLQAGDLINIDVSAELNGYYADAGHSFQIPPYTTKVEQLCKYTYSTMMKVILSLRAGVKLNQIGKIIQDEARKGGYRVVQNLCSHGVGKALHEEPYDILPYYEPRDRRVLKAGQVITIEPFLSTGAEYVVEQADGWTLTVPDRSLAAQHEHTIIITNGRPIIVTAC